MNNLILVLAPLLGAALVANISCAQAQTTETISLTQAAPAALRLRISSPTAPYGHVLVVRVSTKQTLFTEQYHAPEYGHRFDFSGVPSGRYLVWLQTGNSVYRYLVRVQTKAQSSVARVDKLTSRPTPPSVTLSSIVASSQAAEQ